MTPRRLGALLLVAAPAVLAGCAADILPEGVTEASSNTMAWIHSTLRSLSAEERSPPRPASPQRTSATATTACVAAGALAATAGTPSAVRVSVWSDDRSNVTGRTAVVQSEETRTTTTSRVSPTSSRQQNARAAAQIFDPTSAFVTQMQRRRCGLSSSLVSSSGGAGAGPQLHAIF